jgi:hypothetical protein
MRGRWSDDMEGPNLKKKHWRKSNQWFALTRDHAEIVTTNNDVAEAFKK